MPNNHCHARLTTQSLRHHKTNGGALALVTIDVLMFVVSFLAHVFQYAGLPSLVFATSLAVMTHMTIWRGISLYNKEDAATMAVDPLLLQYIIYYIYLGLSAIPPLLDSSYLERALQGTDGFYLGMPLAMGGMVAMHIGCRAAGYTGLRAGTVAQIRAALCNFSIQNRVRLLVILLGVTTILWSLRLYQINTGYYSSYTHSDETLVSGWMSIAIYLPYTLQYFVVPVAALVYVGTSNRFVISLVFVVLGLEVFNGFAVSHRTLILTLAVQAVSAFVLLRKTAVMKVVISGVLGLLLFIAVVQPAIFAYRVVVRDIAITGDQYAEVFWGELWTDTAESIQSGDNDHITSDWAARDLGYRLAAQGYLSALAKAVLLDGREPPYGEFTLRNAASVVPSLFWPGKRKYSIGFMKAEMPTYYRIPRTDYNQTLPAHFFADAGTPGLLLGMLCFGIYLGIVAKFFLLGMTRSPVRFIMMLALVPVLFFHLVGDFKNFFIVPWRECFVIYILMWLGLKATWKGPRIPTLEKE